MPVSFIDDPTVRPYSHDDLLFLTHQLTIALVTTLSGADDEQEVTDWINQVKTPTDRQMARIEFARAQFIRLSDAEGPVIALAWIKSETPTSTILQLIRENLFDEVHRRATQCMLDQV